MRLFKSLSSIPYLLLSVVAFASVGCGPGETNVTGSNREVFAARSIQDFDGKYCAMPDLENPDFDINSLVLDKRITEIDILKLHSKPGASYKIFLDFDGDDLSNSAWSISWHFYRVIPLFDLSNPVHRMAVYAIWQIVSENFAVFNIDVTTEEPASYELGMADPNDIYSNIFERNAMRANIGANKFLENSAGVAMLGTFQSIGYWPALISVSMRFSPEDIAMVISHEIGHVMGLSHDGLSDKEYHSGTPNWGPVMGSPYRSRKVQWSRGDYTDATSHEDDLKRMANVVGVEGDDYGNDFSSAFMLQTGGPVDGSADMHNLESAPGIIERPEDKDFFGFYGRKAAEFVVSPVDSFGNRLIAVDQGALTPLLRVIDSAGTELARTTGTSIKVRLPADGAYALEVSANSSEIAPGVQSAYGSVGRYSVTAVAGKSSLTGQGPGRIDSFKILETGSPGNTSDSYVSVTIEPTVPDIRYVIEMSNDRGLSWQTLWNDPNPVAKNIAVIQPDTEVLVRVYGRNEYADGPRSKAKALYRKIWLQE